MGCRCVMEGTQYDWDGRMLMSEGVSEAASVAEILAANIPGACEATRAEIADDKNGTDWWVRRSCGHSLSVDCKVREKDWAAKPEPQRADDLALEIWSVYETRTVGWTLRKDKRTDYILWLWKNTGRWCLVPFPMLCCVFWLHGKAWCAEYKKGWQHTKKGDAHWWSECVFVPRSVVWGAIIDLYGGTPQPLTPAGRP